MRKSDGIQRSALISPCGLYRYWLSRTWDASLPRVVFLMMNPSTADGTVDDATIRKCIGFAKTWGYGGVDVVNLFAYRSRNPDDLLSVADPVGPEYLGHLANTLNKAKQVVAAWGCDSTLKKQERLRTRPAYVIRFIRNGYPNLPVSCLGYTKQGSPKHPLMLGYSTPLEPFTTGQSEVVNLEASLDSPNPQVDRWSFIAKEVRSASDESKTMDEYLAKRRVLKRIEGFTEEQYDRIMLWTLGVSATDKPESLTPVQTYHLDATQWAEFQEALSAPPRDLPGLTRLLKEPSVFETGLQDDEIECINCPDGKLESRTTDVPGKLKGEHFTIRMPALTCPSCGFITIEGRLMPEYMRLLADAYRTKHELLTSSEIKQRRILHGVSHKEFADELGVEETDVKHWEMGKVQPAAIDPLIRALTPPSPIDALLVPPTPAELTEENTTSHPDPLLLEELQALAYTSDDPDTQTACLIVSFSGDILARSANRLPDGVVRTLDRVTRPAKYKFVMHAERRAIANAARSGESFLEGSTMYLNWFPCSDCAQVIIQAGIKTLVADQKQYEARKNDERYGFAEAMEMLTEAQVQVIWA